MSRLRLAAFHSVLLLSFTHEKSLAADSGISWRVGAGASYRTMGGIRFDTGSF